MAASISPEPLGASIMSPGFQLCWRRISVHVVTHSPSSREHVVMHSK
jgi:hypothetical protein